MPLPADIQSRRCPTCKRIVARGKNHLGRKNLATRSLDPLPVQPYRTDSDWYERWQREIWKQPPRAEAAVAL